MSAKDVFDARLVVVGLVKDDLRSQRLGRRAIVDADYFEAALEQPIGDEPRQTAGDAGDDDALAHPNTEVRFWRPSSTSALTASRTRAASRSITSSSSSKRPRSVSGSPKWT